MTRSIRISLALGILVLLGGSRPCNAQVPEYTPEQALSLLDRQIRSVFGYPPNGPLPTNPPSWLSLTYVGQVVTEDDPAGINIMLNQCPPASQTLGSFYSSQRLDQVYELVLKKSALAKQSVQVPGLDDAKKYLIGPSGLTPQYQSYLDLQSKYLDEQGVLGDLIKAGNAAQVNIHQVKLKNALNAWILGGNKAEVEKALDKTRVNDAISNETNVAWRLDNLTASRVLADPTVDPSGAIPSNVVPKSVLHPSPGKWDLPAGWTKVSFTKTDTFSSSEETYRSSNRYVSGGGGFLFWRASAGGSKFEEKRENSTDSRASNIHYEFEVRRATIDRPWLDQRFFFNPGFWTWLRPDGVGTDAALPRVSKGVAGNGPVDNSDAKYDGAPIATPLLPTEVIVARNVTLTATVNKALYNKIDELSKSDFSASGSAFFFFHLGGGGQNTSTLKKITESGDKVDFSLTIQGPVIIGYISQVIPTTPAPDLNKQWPVGAWLPVAH
jgi:hypothetical protein